MCCVTQADYAREAIPWTVTDFVDNQPCVDLLQANPGVFAILNEVCCSGEVMWVMLYWGVGVLWDCIHVL